MEPVDDDVDVDSLLLSSSNEEGNDASDSDEDLIQMENITDLDSSVEIVETVNKAVKFRHFITQSDDAAACLGEVIEDQVDGERRIVKKCRVLVRKLKLGEIRESEEKHSEHILNQNNGANGSNRSPHTRWKVKI